MHHQSIKATDGCSPHLDVLKVSDELQRLERQLSCAIELLASESGHTDCWEVADPYAEGITPRFVHRLLQAYQGRRQAPPEAHSDPSWDMMLAVYAADLESRGTSLGELRDFGLVPSVDAIHCVSNLIRRDLLVAEITAEGWVKISLSCSGKRWMAVYFETLAQTSAARGIPIQGENVSIQQTQPEA